MSPSDIHSATANIFSLLAAIGGGGAFNIGILFGWEKWRARRKGKQEGTMEQKVKNLEDWRAEDREVINGFKDTLESISSQTNKLALQFAAYTQIANGVDYRKRGES